MMANGLQEVYHLFAPIRADIFSRSGELPIVERKSDCFKVRWRASGGFATPLEFRESLGCTRKTHWLPEMREPWNRCTAMDAEKAQGDE
jgi:hypothetical protein